MVLPVPGPPVIIDTPFDNAVITAWRCSSAIVIFLRFSKASSFDSILYNVGQRPFSSCL